MTFDVTTLEGYKQLLEERRAIYIRKEIDKIEPPYTEDPILQTEKFCNVDRENDFMSRVYRKSLIGKDLDFQVFSAFLFRIARSPMTICDVFENSENMAEVMEQIMKPDFKFSYQGKRIAVSPYRVPIVSNKVKTEKELALGNTKTVFNRLWEQHDEILDYLYSQTHSKTPLEMTHELAELINVPSKLMFMTHQILADLSVIIPDNVDPNGITYMAIGAEAGLKTLAKGEGWTNDRKRTDIFYYKEWLETLMEYTGESCFVLEHFS